MKLLLFGLERKLADFGPQRKPKGFGLERKTEEKNYDCKWNNYSIQSHVFICFELIRVLHDVNSLELLYLQLYSLLPSRA